MAKQSKSRKALIDRINREYRSLQKETETALLRDLILSKEEIKQENERLAKAYKIDEKDKWHLEN